MNRLLVIGILACLLLAGTATAQQRPQCYDPFPIFNPPHPGTCFVDTPIGSFFFLFDGSDFLLVETFGDADDHLKLRPNGRISAHQTAREARFVYCPPAVTGRDCLLSVFRPGPKAFVGSGRLSVNTEMDAYLSFTCPSAVTARGLVTDPDTGESRRLVAHLMRVRQPDGTCRDILYDIRLAP